MRELAEGAVRGGEGGKAGGRAEDCARADGRPRLPRSRSERRRGVSEVCERCLRWRACRGTRESRRGMAAPRARLAPASAAAAAGAERGVGRGASLACIAAAVSLPKHCSTQLFCIHRSPSVYPE